MSISFQGEISQLSSFDDNVDTSTVHSCKCISPVLDNWVSGIKILDLICFATQEAALTGTVNVQSCDIKYIWIESCFNYNAALCG